MINREEEIRKLKQVLLKRRDALRKALAGDLSALRELADQSSGDEIDLALDSVYDEMNSRLAELESRELAKIEDALERMRDGTYGICEVTGRPIPLARLQALPYATTCIEAQRELEKMSQQEREEMRDWSQAFDVGDLGDHLSLNDMEFA